jgi:hypothetical protein
MKKSKMYLYLAIALLGWSAFILISRSHYDQEGCKSQRFGKICRSEDPARFQRALDEDLFLACAMGAGAIVLLVSASRAAKKGC